MNKNHVVFHGSVNSASLSAAAHAGGSVHEAGLQLVAQTQAHGRTQRDTVDGVRRDGHFHLQLLAEVLRQAVELCAPAGEADAELWVAKCKGVPEALPAMLRRAGYSWMMIAKILFDLARM